MFDPHRIGPRRSSSYARNKGRVIQRRLVDTPSPGYTRTELEELVPLMRKNGFIPEIPPPPGPINIGPITTFTVFDGYNVVTDNYMGVTGSGTVEVYLEAGGYFMIVPNVPRPLYPGDKFIGLKAFVVQGSGNYYFSNADGARLYKVSNDGTSNDATVWLMDATGNGVAVGFIYDNVTYPVGSTIPGHNNVTVFAM